MEIGDKVKIKVVTTWITGTISDYVETDILKWKVAPDREWFDKIWRLRKRIAKSEKNIYPISA